MTNSVLAHFKISVLLIASLFVIHSQISKAEDIDLFVQDLDESIRGNVLFVMDNSGSMGAIAGYKFGRPFTRMKAVKDSMKRFISSAENINFGLMSFSRSTQGGKVDLAVNPIEGQRATALSIVDGYTPNVIATPLAETLYEAMLYFQGEIARYGRSESASGSIAGGRYISPAVQECQKNNIIYFTDGEPWRDRDIIGKVHDLLSGKTLPSSLDPRCNGWGVAGSCFDELSWYLNNTDLRDGLPGNQNARIFTIAGFGAAWEELMRNAAEHGGGEFYSALNEVQLDNALADILSKVREDASIFTAPATTTDAFNALETGDEVYFVMFQPVDGKRWKGNLKRYRLGDDNQIYDADDNLAIDPVTGFFRDSARSFWSSEADGQSIESGGMAENRNQNAPAFTNIGGDRDETLSLPVNKLHEINGKITEGVLGVLSASNRETVIKWARGVDVDDEDNDGSNTDNRLTVGDPLHTQPVVINYFSNDRTVYFSTNDGFLYGVNADNGATEFSFIPQDLLGNLSEYRGIDGNEWRVIETFSVSGSLSYTTTLYHNRVYKAGFPQGGSSQNMELSAGRYDIFDGSGSLTNREVRVVNGGKTLELSTNGTDWSQYQLTVTKGFFSNFGKRIQYVLSEPRDNQNKIYGLDGPIAFWVNDLNGNGRVLKENNGFRESGEHVYLYLTMRRGGNNIYALDVTNRTSPVLKWVIRGNDNNGSDLSGDFGHLGQTWSKPKLTTVRWNGENKKVLFFGGGYDPSIDTPNVDVTLGKNLLLRSWQTDNNTETIEALPATTYGPGLGSVIAYEMEADSDDTGNIYQYIKANKGDTVRVTLDYSARVHDPGDGSTLYVYLGNQWLDVLSRPTHGWHRYTYDLVVDQPNPRFEFHAKDPRGNNSLGGIINSETLSIVKMASASGGGSSSSVIIPSNVGNAVFMVDAETGDLLWKASNSDADLNIRGMEHSIPSNVTLVDIDRDGLTDYLFAADTGGQIIRIDINEDNTRASNFATGGVIARISGKSEENARRFFQSPDVSISKSNDYLNIAIGSGLRQSPLDTSVSDRMYVIKDYHVYQAPSSYNYTSSGLITESNLYNATSNVIQDGSIAQRQSAQILLNDSHGWYIVLEEEGEKILSDSNTFNGVLLFSSFVVNKDSAKSCSSKLGENYFYAVDIENASSVLNLDAIGSLDELNKGDRKTILKHGTIAPGPSVINQGVDGYEICIGLECFKDTLQSIGSVPVKSRFWRENR